MSGWGWWREKSFSSESTKRSQLTAVQVSRLGTPCQPWLVASEEKSCVHCNALKWRRRQRHHHQVPKATDRRKWFNNKYNANLFRDEPWGLTTGTELPNCCRVQIAVAAVAIAEVRNVAGAEQSVLVLSVRWHHWTGYVSRRPRKWRYSKPRAQLNSWGQSSCQRQADLWSCSSHNFLITCGWGCQLKDADHTHIRARGLHNGQQMAHYHYHLSPQFDIYLWWCEMNTPKRCKSGVVGCLVMDT